jgi:hypothetical protein
MGKWDNFIQVKQVKGHTCTLDSIDARHRNISANFVASRMYPHIVNTPEYAPKEIISAIEEKFVYTSVTAIAWYAKLFERLCEQNQQKKFDAIWKKLDELTNKASEEIAKRPVNPEPREESISLEDVGLDGPHVRRRRGRAVKTFSQWIKNEPKEK